jgi:hypothetical protein
LPFGGALSLGVGAGTSLLGGIFGGKAAKKAAQIQSETAGKVAGMATQAATNAQTGVANAVPRAQEAVSGAAGTANDTLAHVFTGQTANLNPYLAAGGTGLDAEMGGINTFADMLKTGLAPGGDLSGKFSFNPSDLENDPGYKFQLQQGMQAIQRAQAATGQGNSGATLKALSQYNQGLAGTTFNNAFQRALTTFGTNRQAAVQNLGTVAQLAGMGSNLVGQGLNATSQYNQAATNFGNVSSSNTMQAGMFVGNSGIQGAEYSGNVGLEGARIAGSALTGGANAQAAGTMGAANAWSGALGGVANAVNMYGANRQMNSPYGWGGVSNGTNIPGYDPSSALVNPYAAPGYSWAPPH